ARPAYENGNIHNWVPYLLDSQKFVPQAMGECSIGALRTVVGMAHQAESDIGPRHLRFAFFEDGGGLVNIFLTAPMAVERMVWDAAIKSFRLARPRGQSAHPVAQKQSAAEPVEDAADEAPMAPPSRSGEKSKSGYVPDRSKPEWWNRAARLEQENKLEEAEKT